MYDYCQTGKLPTPTLTTMTVTHLFRGSGISTYYDIISCITKKARALSSTADPYSLLSRRCSRQPGSNTRVPPGRSPCPSPILFYCRMCLVDHLLPAATAQSLRKPSDRSRTPTGILLRVSVSRRFFSWQLLSLTHPKALRHHYDAVNVII